MADKDILNYADNSPLVKEMNKPAIKYIKNQSYGVRKLSLRVKNNHRKVFRNG